MKICIVTPELAGPNKNGGIGTFCVQLCSLLSGAGHEVALLYTEVVGSQDHSNWQEFFRSKGIQLKTVDSLENRDAYTKLTLEEPLFLRSSRRIAEYLESQSFDLVHFQDWQGNGFHSIRRRRCGTGLCHTRIAVTLHSPAQWIREGMAQLITDPVGELTQDFVERYCCENADELIAPTQHMLDWATSRGWRILANTRVLPYPHQQKPAPTEAAHASADPTHLIFFGRLETRKGLGIFLDGLNQYFEAASEPSPRQITFLGKPGEHLDDRPVLDVLEDWIRRWPELDVRLELDHDAHSAIRYLKQTGGVAFLPSLLDNCPYAIIECIEHKIPFLAARSGGIPEIVHPRHLVDPSATGILQALHTLNERVWEHPQPYDGHQCNKEWLRMHSNSGTPPRQQVSTNRSSRSSPMASSPLVSVCIPYCDLPDFLPQALLSIEQNSYKNVQVIVCDDGSRSSLGQQVFQEQKRRYAPSSWSFVQQSNQGVGLARNRAAAMADGEYLVFMDADNVANPDMLEVMVRAMQRSDSDLLTSYFKAFSKTSPPDASTFPDYVDRSLGAAPLLCLLENTFGDANCILKRSAFEAVGGFRGPPLSAYADWDFYLRLHSAGFRLDIIPCELFWYRHRRDSMLRKAPLAKEHNFLVQTALKEHPRLALELTTHVALPLYLQLPILERRVGRDQFNRLKAAPVPWHKHLYRWYRRLLGDPRYQKRVS